MEQELQDCVIDLQVSDVTRQILEHRIRGWQDIRDSILSHGDSMESNPQLLQAQSAPIITLVAALILTGCFLKSSSDETRPKVIYGDDNRVEVNEAPPVLAKAASGVALLIRTEDLSADPNNTDNVFLKSQSLAKRYNLCASERFAQQPTAGFCTGFLVAPDVLVTAGHCLTDIPCSEVSFVFGFTSSVFQKNPVSVSKSSVFACKNTEVIYTYGGESYDFAITRLSTPAPYPPLSVRKADEVQENQTVAIIGHPAGLPLKIAAGEDTLVQRVRSDGPRFDANLDILEINSGSPVVDAQTGVVEGILVGGWADFISTESGCRSLFRCENDCPGSQALRTSAFRPYLPSETPLYGGKATRDINLLPQRSSATTCVPSLRIGIECPLPDADPEGYTLTFAAPTNWNVLDLGISLKLMHSQPNELQIKLQAPSGKTLTVVGHSQLKEDDGFTGVFGLGHYPVFGLADFVNEKSKGTWAIQIIDDVGGGASPATGTILDAKLILRVEDIQ